MAWTKQEKLTTNSVNWKTTKWVETPGAALNYDEIVAARAADRTKRFTGAWASTYINTLFENALKNAGPFPTTGYDYGYWFNYYWAESRENLSVKDQLWKIYSVVFDYERMLQLTSGGPENSLYLRSISTQQIPHEEFTLRLNVSLVLARRVLDELFKLGFEEAPAKLTKNTSNLFYSTLWIPGLENKPDGTEVTFEAHYARLKENLSQGVRLGFRGDGRKPDLVKAHGGTRAKVDIPYTLQFMNMNQPWHPFSDTTQRSKMWMRKASRDHDYESITSVTYNLDTAFAYPMVKLTDDGFAGPVSSWSIDKRQVAKNRFKTVGLTYVLAEKTATGQRDLLIGSETNVYVLNVSASSSTAVDTFYYKGYTQEETNYPERGMRGFTWDQTLAVFFCRRVHHPTPEQVSFNSTQHSSTVFIESYQILEGASKVPWTNETMENFKNDLERMLVRGRNGMDIGHRGATSKIASYRIVEWDTKLWKTVAALRPLPPRPSVHK